MNLKKSTLISAMVTASFMLVGCGSDSDTKANLYPNVEAGSSFTITEEEEVTLSGAANDEDGSVVSTLWTQISGPTVTLSNPIGLEASFIAPLVTEQTDLVFQLSATDDEQATSVDNVTITVQQVQIANVSEAFSVLERRGVVPELDRDNSLYGVDSDSNGIRDDIDQFIKNENLPPEQEKALNQMAASMQEQVTVDIDDANAITIAAENGTKALNCVVKTFQDFSLTKKYSKTLEAYTANTFERTQNYLRYNHKLDGTVSSLPTENTCL